MSGNEEWRKSCSEAEDRVKVGGAYQMSVLVRRDLCRSQCKADAARFWHGSRWHQHLLEGGGSVFGSVGEVVLG
jgi:hypothetical protein